MPALAALMIFLIYNGLPARVESIRSSGRQWPLDL